MILPLPPGPPGSARVRYGHTTGHLRADESGGSRGKARSIRARDGTRQQNFSEYGVREYLHEEEGYATSRRTSRYPPTSTTRPVARPARRISACTVDVEPAEAELHPNASAESAPCTRAGSPHG